MARARQYADRVNIIKMVKVNGKWPFARIVERDGRITRDHVWVDARAATARIVTREMNPSSIIKSLERWLMGIASQGLTAVALVTARSK